MLKQRPLSEVPGVDAGLHELAPSTARKAWDELKLLVTEKATHISHPFHIVFDGFKSFKSFKAAKSSEMQGKQALSSAQVSGALQEQPTELDGSKYVSLRLDGCMFGRLTRELRELGVIGRGYSEARKSRVPRFRGYYRRFDAV